MSLFLDLSINFMQFARSARTAKAAKASKVAKVINDHKSLLVRAKDH